MSSGKTLSQYSEEELLEKVVSILVERLQPRYIYLFGSRATNRETIRSDFDIAFEQGNYSYRDIRKAREELDQGLGIYSFDLVDLNKSEKSFKEYVRETGKIIYERDQEIYS